MRKSLRLGYSVGGGDEVSIPLKHMAVTGQTQEAGKTTALESLIARSGLRAVTFITKRGEDSFVNARRINPYFREQADWQFVASILEASRSEKLKFERAWIIRASKGANSLADVQRNVLALMEKSKGMSADVYLTLDAYLEAVVPQIARVKWATSVDLAEGVNVVDLTGLNVEMQHLVIKSTITWVLEREQNTVVVVPEAWKFIPQGRGTPVKLAAESFIRQAAALGNFLWLDSQDIAGVDKIILKSVPVWILGVQREANEIKRTLDNIPAGLAKPKAADIATLSLGQFYACWGRHSIKTYVQPAWLSDKLAKEIAVTGEVDKARKFEPKKNEHDMAHDQKMADLEAENAGLRRQIDELKKSHARIVTGDRVRPHEQSQLLTGTPTQSWAETSYSPSNNKLVQTGPIHLDAVDRAVTVSVSEDARAFNTNTVKGKILYTLVSDLGNKPSTMIEISSAMAERGWKVGANTMSPEIGGLVKNGDLIGEGETRGKRYRLPGKLRISIDGKQQPN